MGGNKKVKLSYRTKDPGNQRSRSFCGLQDQCVGDGIVGVAVLALVGDDEHRGVVGGSLHVLPSWAPSHAAALVVASANNKI